tara:strand:- start:3893 stop:4528 length:636 start_codon:yes stop_codon:yes gene_type:complete
MKTYDEQFLRGEYDRMLTDYDLNKSEFGFEDYLRNNNLGLELKKIRTAENEGAGMGTYMAIGGVGLALAGMVGVNVLNNKLMGLQSNMNDMILGNNPMDTIDKSVSMTNNIMRTNAGGLLGGMRGDILDRVKRNVNIGGSQDFLRLNQKLTGDFMKRLKYEPETDIGYGNLLYGVLTGDARNTISQLKGEGGGRISPDSYANSLIQNEPVF